MTELEAKLLAAVKANHEWHTDHDDYDGYPGSDLEALNVAALAAAESDPEMLTADHDLLRQQPVGYVSDDGLESLRARKPGAPPIWPHATNHNHHPLFALPAATEPVNARLLEALRFYAEGHHFVLHAPDSWDTVSGEPQNLLEDEANTATVEDGSIARAAIAAAEAQQAGPVRLVEALNKRCYMFSEKHLSGYRIVLGFEAQGDADEAIDQLSKPRTVKNQPQPCGD